MKAWIVGVLCACGSPAKPPSPPANAPVSGLGGVTVTSLSVGSLHVCVSLSDGTVRCWGHNEDGQVTTTKSEPVRVPTIVAGVSNVASVQLDERHSNAIRRDGSVIGWGQARTGIVDNPPQERQLCAREGDTVTCEYEEGQPKKLSGTVALASAITNCALMKNDTVQCIGANAAGQLADGGNEFRPTWGPVAGVTNVAQLVAAGSWVCVRHKDATVTCWGGDVSRGHMFTAPTRVKNLTDAAELFPGDEGVCARKTSGAVVCWGWIGVRSDDIPTIEEMENIVAKPMPSLDGATAIHFTDSFGCAIIRGDVACWGDNDYGELGDGTRERREVAKPVKW